MKMKYLVFLIIFLKTKLISGQDCALVNVADGNRLNLSEGSIPITLGTFKKNFNIGDTLPGVFEVSKIDIIGLADTNGYCKSAYFNFILENNKLSFALTNEFKNFDDEVIDQSNVQGCDFFLNFKADPSCGITNTRLDFYYNILDVNMNEPAFEESTYDLHITFPVAKATSLLKLSNDEVEIKAFDKDFSTKKLDFQIVEDYAKTLFNVEPLSGSSHWFPVDIKTKDLLYLQESITFTLKATDDGTDPEAKSGTTEITITLNDESEPPIPKFENYFFQGLVDLNTAQVNDFINDDLPIKLQDIYKNPKFDCDGDTLVMNYFECEQQADQVFVKLIKMPDETLWQQNQVPVLKVSASITTDGGNIESTNDVPFVITIENILDSTTTPESTTETTTETATENTSETTTESGTGNPGSSSSSSEDPTNPTNPTDPTDSTDPTVTTTEGNSASECTEKDPDSDLITVIIILSIIACVLLLALIYGYFKYVKGRKSDDKAHLLDPHSNNNADDISNNNSETSHDEKFYGKRSSVDSETYSKPLDALPRKDEIQIQNESDREPKGLDRLIAEQEENNLLKPVEVKSRKRSMTFSESDDESRQYRENLSEPVTSEIINENKPDPVRKKSVVTFKL